MLRRTFRGKKGPRPLPLHEQLITDLPLIKRYSDINEDEDYSFRSYLKSYHPGSELDDIVHEITDDVWEQIDCTKCANCCTTMETPLNPEDKARLAKRFNISEEEFTQTYMAMYEDEFNTQRLMLKSLPCVFLDSNNRCTVYEDRPDTCREYPFLYKNDFASRLLGVIGNASCCPIVFNVWQRLKHLLWRRNR